MQAACRLCLNTIVLQGMSASRVAERSVTHVDANRVWQDAVRSLGVLDINYYYYHYDLTIN